VLQPLRRDADTAVDDHIRETRELAVGQGEAPAGREPESRRLRQRDAAARRPPGRLDRELHRIGQEVIHNLFQLARVRVKSTPVLGGLILTRMWRVAAFSLTMTGCSRTTRTPAPARDRASSCRPHLGQVEDVVDEGEKMLPLLKMSLMNPVCGRSSPQEAVLEHLGEAMMAFSGVLSSCDMLPELGLMRTRVF